ncbi:MAG: hypothetical protein ABJJ26_18085, partial [Algoriphagus sp.]
GSLSDIDILRGIGGGADEEVIRIIENAPNWIPGEQRERVVNTRMRIPVRFRLDGNSNEVKKSPTQVTDDFPATIEVPVRN